MSSRRIVGIIVLVAMIPSLLFAVLLWLLFASRPAPLGNGCGVGSSVPVLGAGVLPDLTPEQQRFARIIIREGLSMKVPTRGLVVAITAASQESGLVNVHDDNPNDFNADSNGLFQERPSQGWGTDAQVSDPVYASRKFYSVLLKVPGWQSMPVGAAAQAVERSGSPGAYDQWIPRAWKVVRAALNGSTSTVVPVAVSGGDGFNIASFNVLGKSHTGGSSANRRMHNAVKVLAKHRIDVVGFQEMQGGQLKLFNQLTGNTWRTYHAPGDSDNTIGWNPAVFTGPQPGSRFLSVPYFDGHHRQMPVLRLLNRRTNQTMTFLNVHNPADTKQYHHQARWRQAAIDVEIPVLNKAAAVEPTFETGDMNDHDEFYGPMKARSVMRGESANTYGGIDWILSSSSRVQVQTDDSPLVDHSTDHPFIFAHIDTAGAQAPPPEPKPSAEPIAAGSDEPVLVDGKKVSAITARQIALAEKIGHIDLHVMQGGYGGSHILASGTSHNYPGVADISPGTIAVEKLLRQVGFAAWARNIEGRSSVGRGAHVHAVSLLEPGDKKSPQVFGSWAQNKDGLRGGPGSDPAPHYSWIPNLAALVAGTDITSGEAGEVVPAAQEDCAPTQAPALPPEGPGGPFGAPDGIQELDWHNGWRGPRLADWDPKVLAETDVIPWGILQSAAGGTGRLTSPPTTGYSSPGAARADILTQIAKGKRVIIGMGGSSDGGITITNPAQVAQARASINEVVRDYGFNGLNLDLEPSGANWNQESIVQLVAGLKADHPGFYIDVCAGLYGEHTARWIALGKALGPKMDSMSVMLYDFEQAGDSRLTGVSVDKTGLLVARGIPANKVILLYFMRPDPGYGNSTPNPGLVVDALRAVLAKYPTLRGFGWWEDSVNHARNWDGPKAVEAALGKR